KLYNNLANKFEYILICSDQAENGLNIEEYRKIGNYLLEDVTKKFNIDTNRIYVGGFSGGARVAAHFAIVNKTVKSLILNSAGFDQTLLHYRKDLTIIGIAGVEDFNMPEMYQSFQSIFKEKNHQKALFLMFNGKHELSDELNMELAFDFANEKSVNNSISKTEADEEFARITNELKPILSKEIELRNYYIDHLMKHNDLNWWKQEITKLISPQNDNVDYIAMTKRLCGFLSIYCYSNTNAAIKSGQLTNAEYYSKLYEIVDPTNAEWAYLQAVLSAQMNQADDCLNKLRKCAELHFNDRNRMQNQVEFRPFASSKPFQEIINQLETDTLNN
ncbi:MAG: hypothetical protein HYZ42_06370, partial [Bacteroidetes bacterium]|nr:hypothetical protein [Bacteroidota bacterium]